MQRAWLTGPELISRWKVDANTIIDLITAKKLSVYNESTRALVIPNELDDYEGDFFEGNPDGMSISFDGLRKGLLNDDDRSESRLRCIFQVKDIEEYEERENIAPFEPENKDTQTNDMPTKSRADQDHKGFARTCARVWWSNSNETKVKMAEQIIEFAASNHLIGRNEQELKTIERWIKDLNPNRKPGRRPK